MSEDYGWMNAVRDRRRSRAATLRPDEEPDDDMLTSAERFARDDHIRRLAESEYLSEIEEEHALRAMRERLTP